MIQTWLGQVPFNITTKAKEMIQKSMELKRFNESKRLIKSVIVLHLTVSLAMILAMLVLIRTVACSLMPQPVAQSVNESFWLQTACFIINWVWSDFTGRGLLLTFKRHGAYLKARLLCTYLITFPAVFINVFVVSLGAQTKFFLDTEDRTVRIW